MEISNSVKLEFANILMKPGIIEQSGKGISTIISKYGREVFHFGSLFIEGILLLNIVDKEKYYQLIGKMVLMMSTKKGYRYNHRFDKSE